MSSFYPVVPSVALPGVAFGRVGAGLLAVRAEDLAAGPVRTAGRRGGGQAPARDRRGLLTLAEGALPARQGDQVIVYRPVLAGTLRAYDNGDLALSGRAADHVSLGAAEAELDRRLGPGALDRLIAEAFAQFRATTPPGGDDAVPDDAVRGQETAFALTRGVVVRALVLGSWMAGTGWDDVLASLFAPVADVPFTRCSATPGGPAFSRARRGVPGVVVAAVCEAVLAVLRAELLDPHDPQALAAGAFRVAGFDGTLLRLPDTAANRERFGAGTDPAPFPHVRLLVDVDAGTKTPLGYAHGPSSGAKDAGEQTLLEQVATATPAICHPGLLHVGDRNFPGAERLRRLTGAGMNLAVRLRAGITVDVDTWLPDGSALVDLGTDDVLHGWRDVEWDVFADGAHTGETFAVATNVTDPAALPALALAAGYRARWGATETPIRETKATLNDSGPGAGPMLRATDPFEVGQEIPALLLGAALLRAVQRSVAAQATPAQRGARAGQPVLARELSTKATVLAITRHLGAATPGLPDEVVASRLAAVHSALGRRRNTPDRNRTRERRAKSVSEFPHAGPGLTTRKVVYETRICGPIVDTLTTAAPILTLPGVTERDHTPQPAIAA